MASSIPQAYPTMACNHLHACLWMASAGSNSRTRPAPMVVCMVPTTSRPQGSGRPSARPACLFFQVNKELAECCARHQCADLFMPKTALLHGANCPAVYPSRTQGLCIHSSGAWGVASYIIRLWLPSIRQPHLHMGWTAKLCMLCISSLAPCHVFVRVTECIEEPSDMLTPCACFNCFYLCRRWCLWQPP